jgi:hypothetical protein
MGGNLRITDLIDIAIVAAILFAGIVWLRARAPVSPRSGSASSALSTWW